MVTLVECHPVKRQNGTGQEKAGPCSGGRGGTSRGRGGTGSGIVG